MRKIVMRAVAAVGLLSSGALGAAGGGCTAKPEFHCAGNDDCIDSDGTQGVCETNGYCSFADTACTGSGRRYADGASTSLTGTCVPAGNACIQTIALGKEHSCALRTDGAVFCWGPNVSGEIGDGTGAPRPSPTKVKGLPQPATDVDSGEGVSCALLKDSTVWCWGDNSTRELGLCNPSPPASASSPVQVMAYTRDATSGAVTCDGVTPFKAKHISVGGKHVCAVGADGNVYCWGENSTQQSGQDPKAFDDVPGPLPVAGLDGSVTVETGDEYSCALKDDGTVRCWGSNQKGSLGVGAGPDTFAPQQVSQLLSAEDLVLDDETACARTNDGGLWCWGRGDTGLFGTDSSNRQTPVRIATVNHAYSGDYAEHLCVTDVLGNLQCWGSNLKGQIGSGSLDPVITKPTAAMLVSVSDVALGEEHTCATTQDGALWCWGDNNYGELGNGQTSNIPVTTPTRIDFPCSP